MPKKATASLVRKDASDSVGRSLIFTFCDFFFALFGFDFCFIQVYTP